MAQVFEGGDVTQSSLENKAGDPSSSEQAVEGDGLRSSPLRIWWSEYVVRLRGEGKAAPPFRPTPSWDPVVAMLLSLCCFFVPVVAQYWGYVKHGVKLTAIISAFGATSAMVFGATQQPGSQPRAVVLGFLFGGFYGVSMNNIFRRTTEHTDIAMGLGAALAVACALTTMKVFSVTHPPGCSAAIVSANMVAYNQQFHDDGYMFLVTPLLLSAFVFVLFAWLGSNAVPWRKHYPTAW
ncbi:transmembrane protein, putative [Bodo saltans]|uniref:Transmembrane protein, putative n=1 Tax=Bodo saltans TaxID=75058 RepID=A0A0S4IRR3_BODSA|nr:transmembrane protein, putative [Bodo saltans]|eukprot:CUF37267.1 transmembrane protein, putative [Bodo saltans]